MIACVDLFCGLGGLTCGLLRGGVSVVCGIDNDPQCRYAYEANNRIPFKEADVTNVSGPDLQKLWPAGCHTLLAGCAPCQPFSSYSRARLGRSADKKWELLAEFGRLVRETSPDLVTMENVPQLARHSVFQEFIKALGDYHTWWDVIDCSKYGVPQTRKRVVLIASRLGPVSLLPPSEFTNAIGVSATVRDAISHLKPLRAGERDPNDPLHAACSLSDLNLRRIKASRPGGTWREWDKDLRADCHVRESGDTYPSVYGRMEWDTPAPTITTQSYGYGNGRFGHPGQDRAISLREAAILQTFPDTYRFLREGERARFSVIGRLIGNAVPVRIGEAIATSLFKHLRDTANRSGPIQ